MDVETVEHLANLALPLWAPTAGGSSKLINLSENHTFRVEARDGKRFALRLHRQGYNDRSAIEGELEWLAALRDDAGLPVSRPIRGTNGELIQTVEGRHAVLFSWEAGQEQRGDDQLLGLFATLGGYAARAHNHAAQWTVSHAVTRPRWDLSVLDEDGIWGNWRAGPHVAAVRSTLDELDAHLRRTLIAYGTGPDRFGLIHADMRLANLLVDGDKVTLIDFDDCGWGWFAYDFAAAVSFMEDSPQLGTLKQRWLAAYRRVRPFSAEDEAAIDVCILLRRMILLAWIGSHSETDLARAQAPDFAATTARLAARYFADGRL